MKKNIIIVIVIIVIVIGAIFLLISKKAISPSSVQTSETTQSQTEALQAYTNQTYGYSLSYPANLQTKVYLPEDVVFGTIKGEMVNGVAEARVINIEGQSTSAFEQSVASQMKNLCAADGPTSSFSCTGIESTVPFTTTSGLSGYMFYLDGELKNLTTKETTKIKKGPYFVLAISSSESGIKALVIHPPLNQPADEANVEVIKNIAESVKVNKPTQADQILKKFIGQNLSKLSPVKAQLGGSFYITDLEAHGGAGTVKYEDGHNAYTADFTYVINSQGATSISSFKLRQ